MSWRQICMMVGLLSLISGHAWGLVLFAYAFFFMEKDDD